MYQNNFLIYCNDIISDVLDNFLLLCIYTGRSGAFLTKAEGFR